MIARVWHGLTTPEHADSYESHLKPELLPGLSQTKGFRGSYLLRRVCVANPISAERERRSESDQSDFRAVATRVAIRSATLATASLKPWSPPILVKTAIAISREG